jgi:ubiquinone/menaquinone biosynthesis C-methylase UbiE
MSNNLSESTSSTGDDNTYVFDPESATELARLINQDRMLTRAMGGPLAILSEEEIDGLRNVVDLACGPGGWVLDVAFQYSEIEVAGVDISKSMIDYANARARSQGLTNASFGVMDITRPLDFADGSFDLVNARFLVAVLLRDAWKPFIAECTRILRPGGILRLTEAVDWGPSSSPAQEQSSAWFYEAMWRVGYGFSPDGRTIGITHTLPSLLRDAGYQHIQLKAHALECSTGTEGWADCYHNAEVSFLQTQPFFVKTGVATQEQVERTYHRMLAEMRASDFHGMWHFLTVQGTKPTR